MNKVHFHATISELKTSFSMISMQRLSDHIHDHFFICCLKLSFNFLSLQHFFPYLIHHHLCYIIHMLIVYFQISFISLSISLLTRILLHILRIKEFFRNLQHPIKIMKQCFSSCSISLFDIYSVNNRDCGETVDNELFEERTSGDRIVLFVNVDDSKTWQSFKFSDLK